MPATIVAPFEIDDYTRWRLLEGLDDMSLTLAHVDGSPSSRRSGRPGSADHRGVVRLPLELVA